MVNTFLLLVTFLSFSLYSFDNKCTFSSGFHWVKLSKGKFDVEVKSTMSPWVKYCAKDILVIDKKNKDQEQVYGLIRIGKFNFMDMERKPQYIYGCVYASASNHIIYCRK
ncbi:hypothetical protein N9N67_00560 [Bacteriovoracaceae bacterium]|nr:hypothetical protein [Bacteriovoracaceae bacterium]